MKTSEDKFTHVQQYIGFCTKPPQSQQINEPLSYEFLKVMIAHALRAKACGKLRSLKDHVKPIASGLANSRKLNLCRDSSWVGNGLTSLLAFMQVPPQVT